MQDRETRESPVFAGSSHEYQALVDSYFQRTASYWKELYQREGLFEVIHQHRKAVVLALVDKLALPPGSHILEIGCGAGLTAAALGQRGFVIEATDTLMTMIDLTRRQAVEAGVEGRVRTSLCDAHELPFPASVFDLVLAVGVTPYLHSPNKAMQEMARVLKPRGNLIVSADNRWRLNHILDPSLFPGLASTRRVLRESLERVGLSQPRPKRVRPHMYSLKEFNELLSRVCIEKLEGATFGFGPFSFLSIKVLRDSLGIRLHRKLQNLADEGFPIIRSTGTQYLVLARKVSLQ
jgi:ubiquinone/menaquinone biosynthesis C-methylase UbiE